MSKITITLLLILFIFLGLLLFVLYGAKQNQIINSLTHPTSIASPTPAETTLSITTNTQTIQAGQTTSVAIIIHNQGPHTSLAQIELAYDPLALSVDAITPGTFFTNPTVTLQNIDPLTGRISYALTCPVLTKTTTTPDCANPNSPTIATITVSSNPYTVKPATTLSFLPKTVVRTHNGKNILQATNGLQLAITRPLFPVSSSSANSVHITPAH